MGRNARATTQSVLSRVDRETGLRICAIIALGCVELIIGGVGGGMLHWSQQITEAAQLPVYVAMLSLMGRSMAWRGTGRREGQPQRRPAVRLPGLDTGRHRR